MARWKIPKIIATLVLVGLSAVGVCLATGNTDGYGDPLPPGACGRLGTARLKYADWAMTFSSDGKWLASGSRDGVVRVWDTTTGKQVRHFPGHNPLVYCVAFSPDKRLLACGDAYNIHLWVVATGNTSNDGSPQIAPKPN